MRFTLILATIQTERKEKPAQCPSCGSRHIQHWQYLVREIRDTKVAHVEVDRWRCRACHIPFQTAPEGITQTVISLRLQRVAIALYMLGLSSRGVEDLLTAMGHPMSIPVSIFFPRHLQQSRLLAQATQALSFARPQGTAALRAIR